MTRKLRIECAAIRISTRKSRPPERPKRKRVRAEKKESFLQRVLNGVERVGNKVPHPIVIFVLLIAGVILLSHLVYLLGTSVTYERINPDTHDVEHLTTTARSLLTRDGIRFMYAGVVQNFMNFNAVGVIIVAMLGVGVAEAAGLVSDFDSEASGRRSCQSAYLHPGVHRYFVERRR